MEEIISKEIAKTLMSIDGTVRGMSIKSHGDFILKEKGRQGLEDIEKMMADLNCPIKYKEIQSWGFYPIGVEVIELLVMKKLFNFNDEKIEEVGNFESISSLVIRIFLKHFISLKTVGEQVPIIWSKYYTVGNLRTAEINEEKRYAILILENFKVHPLYCSHLRGYCSGVLKMVVGTKVSCEETKCSFKGDDYHEFLFKW